MERYYQKEIETMPREELKKLQSEKLVKQVKHAWDNVPYYRAKMEAVNVTPEDIKGIEDLHKLPFITKDDLRECYPYGMLARPLKDVVRIQSTSGTTGRRVVKFYTQDDIDKLIKNADTKKADGVVADVSLNQTRDEIRKCQTENNCYHDDVLHYEPPSSASTLVFSSSSDGRYGTYAGEIL